MVGSRRAASAYIAFAIVQRAVPFLLLPVVTRVVGPAVYGSIAVITSGIALGSVLFGLGLETVVFRARMAAQSSRLSQIAGVSTYLRLGAPLIGVALGGIALIADIHWSGIPRWGWAAIPVTSGLLTPVMSLGLPVLRARERLAHYGALVVLPALVQLGLVYWLVVVNGGRLEGWVEAMLASSAFGYVLMQVLASESLAFGAKGLRAALAFSIPLIPHQLSMWGLNFADRLVMIALVGSRGTGVYNASYQVSTIALVLLTELHRAFSPRYVGTAEPSQRWRLREVIVEHASVMAVLAALGLALSPTLIPVVFRGSFSPGYGYLPPLILAQLIYCLYYIPANVMTLTAGVTRGMWQASLSGAVLNIALNVLLIHLEGVPGAIWANMISYAFMTLAMFWQEERNAGLLKTVLGRRDVAMAVLVTAALGGMAAVLVQV